MSLFVKRLEQCWFVQILSNQLLSPISNYEIIEMIIAVKIMGISFIIFGGLNF